VETPESHDEDISELESDKKDEISKEVSSNTLDHLDGELNMMGHLDVGLNALEYADDAFNTADETEVATQSKFHDTPLLLDKQKE
jgi:hypothetical protein